MALLKKILIGLGVLIALLVLVSLFLPSKIQVERSLVISAPPAAIFTQLTDVSRLAAWNPWLKKDPNVKVELSPSKTGEGAFYKWESDHNAVGSGTLTIIESKPMTFVRNALDFYENGKGEGTWKLEDVNNRIKVTWGFHTEMGSNPVAKYQGLLIERFLGPAMEQGLRNLRDASEQLAAGKEMAQAKAGGQSKELTVQEIDFPEREYIAVRKTVSMRDMEGHFARYFPLMYNSIQMKNIEIAGAPCGFFYEWNEQQGTADIAAAMPVKNGEDLGPQMKVVKIPGGKAVMVEYKGNMNNISAAHLAIQQYVQSNGLGQRTPIIEEYLSDVQTQPDPNKAVTRVYCLLQ